MPIIQPISPTEFGARISNGLIILFDTLNIIIVPLTIVAMGVSTIFLLIGFFTNSQGMKRIGWSGLAGSIGGFFIFKAIPLLIGLWITISKAF